MMVKLTFTNGQQLALTPDDVLCAQSDQQTQQLALRDCQSKNLVADITAIIRQYPAFYLQKEPNMVYPSKSVIKISTRQ